MVSKNGTVSCLRIGLFLKKMQTVTEQDFPLSPASCRAARQLLGMTQAELASLAGISLSTLRRFESGESKPSAWAAGQLAETLSEQGILFIASGQDPIFRYQQPR